MSIVSSVIGLAAGLGSEFVVSAAISASLPKTDSKVLSALEICGTVGISITTACIVERFTTKMAEDMENDIKDILSMAKAFATGDSAKKDFINLNPFDDLDPFHDNKESV